MTTGVCPNSWQPYGCNSIIQSPWESMNWFVRLDIIVLSLLLVYVVVVFTRVSYCYYSARRAQGIDTASQDFQRSRRKLVADLNIAAGSLKSISSIAPYLGLAGTCWGIFNAFRGIGMAKETALSLTASYVAAALITTAAGILVAAPATCFHNYLRARIDLLEAKIRGSEPERKSSSFQAAQRLPLKARFSSFSFALIAASALAILVAMFMIFSAFPRPMGFYVGLAPANCESDSDDRIILLHLDDAGKLSINGYPEDWNSLRGILFEIYRLRTPRTLYLLADDAVPFQTLADALDLVENVPILPGNVSAERGSSPSIKVRLVTQMALNARCPEPAFAGDPGQHSPR